MVPYGSLHEPLRLTLPYLPGSMLLLLRSTSQGVEARLAPLRGRCTNGIDYSQPIRASFVKD